MTIYVKSDDELKRDVFKSESARLFIPEIDLELDYGTLGGIIFWINLIRIIYNYRRIGIKSLRKL